METTNKNKHISRMVSFLEKDTMYADYQAVEAMSRELSQFPEPLHFKLLKHEDGWMAQCEEIKGIITGNTNPNPSNEEVESHIREAIRATFNVSVVPVPKKSIEVFQVSQDPQVVYA